MCDNTEAPQDQIYATMEITNNPNWLSSDIQARIDPPTTPLIKVEVEEEKASNSIKAKIRKK